MVPSASASSVLNGVDEPTLPLPATTSWMFVENRVSRNSVLHIVPVIRFLHRIFMFPVAFDNAYIILPGLVCCRIPGGDQI